MSEEPPRSTNNVDQAWMTLRLLLKYGFWAFIAYCGLQAVRALAGHDTSLLVSLTAHAFAKVEVALPAGWAALMSALFVRERNLRRKTTAYLHGRIKKFELEKDPERTSSLLTLGGATNPKDLEA